MYIYKYTWESKSWAWEKLHLPISSSALFLKASASRLLLHASEESSQPHISDMTSAARAAVPQWPTKMASGRTTRLGPAPQRPRQPQELTEIWGGAIPVRIWRVSIEPCLRHVLFTQTLISVSAGVARQSLGMAFGESKGGAWEIPRKLRLPFMSLFTLPLLRRIQLHLAPALW